MKVSVFNNWKEKLNSLLKQERVNWLDIISLCREVCWSWSLGSRIILIIDGVWSQGLFWCSSCYYSVTQWYLILCNPIDRLLVLHNLPELAQTHVHWVSDVIQPTYPLSSPPSLAFNLSQHQSLFQWVGSSHQVAQVLELQLQHQSLQWIFRIDFL